MCRLDNQTVPVTNCDENSVPFGSENCNSHSCGADEVYTVEPTHDLSEDEEEDCEEEEGEGDEEGMTSPMDGGSTQETVIDLYEDFPHFPLYLRKILSLPETFIPFVFSGKRYD